MRALDVRSIEDGGCVGGHQCDGINAGGSVALSHAAIIQSDRAISLSENWAGAMPHVRWIAQAHDEQQRLARAFLIPVDLGALIFNKWHKSSECQNIRPRRGGEKHSNQIVTQG